MAHRPGSHPLADLCSVSLPQVFVAQSLPIVCHPLSQTGPNRMPMPILSNPNRIVIQLKNRWHRLMVEAQSIPGPERTRGKQYHFIQYNYH